MRASPGHSALGASAPSAHVLNHLLNTDRAPRLVELGASFGQTLCALRRAAGLTQEALAERAGVSTRANGGAYTPSMGAQV